MFAGDGDTVSMGSGGSYQASPSLGAHSTQPRSTSPRSTTPRSSSPLANDMVGSSGGGQQLGYYDGGHVSATESAREDFNDTASDRSSLAGSVPQRKSENEKERFTLN